MYVLKSKEDLGRLKQLLDAGSVKPFEYTYVARGLLQSVLSDLWTYEAVVDTWPETPTSVILRPVKDFKLPFVNRNVYVVSSKPEVLEELLKEKSPLPWNEPISFLKLPVPCKTAVENAARHHRGHLRSLRDVVSYCVVQKKEAEKIKLPPIPAGLRLAPIPLQHLTQVVQHTDEVEMNFADEWTHRTEYCVQHMPSCCVLDTENQPVAWATVFLEGFCAQAYTAPGYRGDRLLNWIQIQLLKELKTQDRECYAHIQAVNEASLKATEHVAKKVGEPVVFYRYYPEQNDSAKL